MTISASSGTPPGTAPQPTRRSTKHKTVAYGEQLLAAHAAREVARAKQAIATKQVAVDAAAAKAERDEATRVREAAVARGVSRARR